ncbi:MULTISPECIES: prepilin peptidase [unclassified Aerococcus]|uniref:prepilin peptidase n=1 Tax=unclassified Aerococcus TaxID=2618060 RepID=UPI0025C65E9A|nr:MULTISPECIES: A24 family peptidase [unclassified Aerococcus]
MISFVYYTILLVFFASLASFFMVVGSRTVLGQSFIHGRSKCDNCQVPISPFALIPIIGYGLSTGKCQTCRQPISLIYPLSEGFFAIFSFLFFLNHSTETAILLFLIFTILLIMTSADLALHIIPDRFQVILLLAVLNYLYRNPDLAGLTHITFSLLVLTTLITTNYLLHQGIGGGDIKTLVVLALMLGPLKFSYLLLIASGLALCHIFYLKIRHTSLPNGLPFIPYLFFAYPIIFYIL